MKLLAILATALMASFASASLQIEKIGPTENIQPQNSYYSHYFGMVMVNSYNTVRYTVTNTGTTPLQFQSANIWGIDYRANHSCGSGLQPNQQCSFEIVYWPFNEGYSSGDFSLTFRTADGMTDTISVRVWGEARR